MEDVEQRAIATAPHSWLWWFRYVDYTHCKLKKYYNQELTDHLNSLDPDIKFTTEVDEKQDPCLSWTPSQSYQLSYKVVPHDLNKYRNDTYAITLVRVQSYLLPTAFCKS